MCDEVRASSRDHDSLVQALALPERFAEPVETEAFEADLRRLDPSVRTRLELKLRNQGLRGTRSVTSLRTQHQAALGI
jgi:hypothetical protein